PHSCQILPRESNIPRALTKPVRIAPRPRFGASDQGRPENATGEPYPPCPPSMLIPSIDATAWRKIVCIEVMEAHILREGAGTVKTGRRIEALEAKVDQLLARSETESLKRCGSETEGSLVNAASASAPRKDIIDQGLLTIDAANALLSEYRSTLASYCPFVIIAPQVTAGQLRREKPFLLLAIITAALYDNMPLQRKLEREVKNAISESMIWGGPVTFEILQGILVHIAWCHYHSRPRRYSQYLHLAISIITDLQLDRSPKHRFWTTRVSFDGDDDDKQSVSWGREETRAVIGCFYFSSAISQVLQKRLYFPYLPYFESLGIDLATNPEYASDKYLLHLVRLQRISEKVTLCSIPNDPTPRETNSTIEHYYGELNAELASYQANLPFPLIENHILFTQFHAVKLYLCQITLFDPKEYVQNPHHDSTCQIDALQMGLAESKTLLDFFINLPLRHDVAFNNAIWVQLGFAVTLASKLSVAAKDSFVQPHAVDLCQALDIRNVLGQCILRIQALITSDMDASGDRNVFYHFEKRLKRAQWWVESRALSGLNNDPLQYGSRLAEAADSSTVTASRHIDSSQPSADGSDPYLQWSGLFPDASIDDIFVDWVGQTMFSFNQRLG
ncbi:hypothetical protein N7526_001379, partial [Penicillium atrosanguineum]